MSLLLQMVRPLLVTILLEGIAAWIWGYRRKREQFQILLVNVITNPIVNVASIFLNLYCPIPVVLKGILLLELLVILAEALLFRYFLDECRHPVLMAVFLNAVSYYVGGWILPFLR